MKLRWWFDDTHAGANVPHPLDLPGHGTNETWTGGGGDDTHNGTKKADTLDGAGGNDTVDGKGGNDSITGGIGDDKLTGGDGNDHLFGGDNNDTLTAGDGTDTLDGGNNDDTAIFGAFFDATDSYAGGAGTDTMSLGGTYGGTITLTNKITGVETIKLNGGATTVVTNDNLLTGSASITINASTASFLNFNGAAESTGAFVVIGSDAADQITGGFGGDTINAGKGDDGIAGGFGNDTLNGEDGNDHIHVGGGTDTVSGGKGDDVIVWDAVGGVVSSLAGGAGVDTMDASTVAANYSITNATSIEHWILTDTDDSFGSGDATDETWEARGGNDTIDAAAGNDTIYGGTGDDRLYGGDGNDTIDGDDGFDIAIFVGATGGVNANLVTHTATGKGTDTLTEIEGLIGGSHNDTLTGDGANNQFVGLEGDDTIDGGGGIDNVYYNSISSGDVTVNLNTGNVTGALGNDHLSNIENVVMGGGNDTVTGDANANVLFGGDGNDTLSGGQGNDFLYGGNGTDTLTGGRGQDVMYGGLGVDSFVFAPLGSPLPTTHYISDIVAGETIDLSAIDAIPGGGDQAFIVVESFNGAKGEAKVDYNSGTDQTVISLDIDGGASPAGDFFIVMNGNHILPPNPPNPEAYDITIIW